MPGELDLARTIDHLVEEWAGVGRRRMFGGLCYTVQGCMFLGLLDNRAILKVSEEDREACLVVQG